ncbi:phosphoglycerate mutase family protein [Dothidotthia symphoricarpi CBS 119687]|uniref:Phosphoglycerate mutase family protein n=1 Tax=Dothidotthia symphoricarpi CBS 119687 TaxID=1392245 RepID=A0A6A6AET1_9PLEO|nr:phosphoglycerate mutase family protein [Dothidotthia symphoricarpi CBS 119687]KAF2129454.1 phosphoglycerate mutase family protein [Dothidotthia symphoricarpi CBS 119687]
MIEVVYIVRHAFRGNWTVDHQTGKYTSLLHRTPTGIPTDPPLTSKGVEQSKELAEYLCNIEPPIDRIYSSPFYRCLQTIKPTTDRLFEEGKAQGKIRIDRGIGEFFGRATWDHPTPPDLTLLTLHFENLDQDHVSLHLPSSKGEMILELHDRVRNALDHIITTLDNDAEQPKTVLLCTHAATMIAAGRVLTGQMPDDPDEDDFKCYTAGLSKFVRRSVDPAKGVPGNWDCVLNSETSYLSGGAERGWHFNGDESFVAFPDNPLGETDTSKL